MRDSDIAPGKVLRTGPEGGAKTDVLVMESTYGNRAHPKTDPRPEMSRIIRDTVQRGGSIVIPAFAVERTQKLLFMLKQLMADGLIPQLPVHVDSPMAIKAVRIFMEHAEEFSAETKSLIAKFGSPLEWQGFFFDETPQQSKKINESNYPAIIVSSSGMVTGGRVLHHLMHKLPDHRNTVMFIGFQAPGTRGAIIKGGAASVRIFSQEVTIRAQVVSIDQFSDHADTAELLEWMRTFSETPDVTYLVHGEPAASSQMQKELTKELGWEVKIAEWMQKVDLG
jgi:metallo-beta-lactamase family protein